MVGIRIPDSGASWTSPFVASDILFQPAEFTANMTTWASVPCCYTNFGNYGNPTTDHLDQIHTPANIARGIGDICRYIDTVDGVKWRMPTAKDWEDLYGSDQINGGRDTVLGNGWTDGNYYPLSGHAMGAGWKYVSISGSGNNAQVTNVDPWINGAVFLPASGRRHSTAGAISGIGSGCLLWSSTAFSAESSYDLQFDRNNIRPRATDSRADAYPIRCIRE